MTLNPETSGPAFVVAFPPTRPVDSPPSSTGRSTSPHLLTEDDDELVFPDEWAEEEWPHHFGAAPLGIP